MRPDLGERARRALGVSRVARVTGLDRAGVEVACAVRPGGHVLQVANGKGGTFEDAAAGAVLEAAELWAAEQVDAAKLIWGSAAELRAAGRTAWDAGDLGSAAQLVAPALWSEATRVAWREGVELCSGARVLVPAQALHCPPPGALSLGPSVVSWTSNGMGAHPDRDAALLHAILEALERDQLARTLPEGWTQEVIDARLTDRSSLGAVGPATHSLVERLRAARFDVYLFDLAPSAEGWGLPVGGALLFDREGGAVPRTAGYCCGLTADSALGGALLEAAQSRLTDIHGAREDVSPTQLEAVEELSATCKRARAQRRAERMGWVGEAEDPRAAVGTMVARFARRKRRIAAFDLEPADVGVHVVKVVIPGFLVSELL